MQTRRKCSLRLPDPACPNRRERKTRTRPFHPLFLSVLPPTTVVDFTGSVAAAAAAASAFTALPRLLPVRLCSALLIPPAFFVVVVVVVCGTVVAVVAAFVALAPAVVAAVGFLTIVVVVVESLAPLLRLLLCFCDSAAAVVTAVAAAGRLICRDAGRVDFAGTGGGRAVNIGFAGLVGRGTKVFVGEAILKGDCGRVRELCDLGDSTWPGAALRETILTVFAGGTDVVVVVLVVLVVVLARFFGFSRTSLLGASFSLSAVLRTSLNTVRPCTPSKVLVQAYLGLLTPAIFVGPDVC